jgi:ParB family transcriptional regulator, chromosome partitioning protein
MSDAAPIVQMIPVDQINVLNPRSRNKVTFQGIVSNISNLGLKKPITVARKPEPTDTPCPKVDDQRFQETMVT